MLQLSLLRCRSEGLRGAECGTDKGIAEKNRKLTKTQKNAKIREMAAGQVSLGFECGIDKGLKQKR